MFVLYYLCYIVPRQLISICVNLFLIPPPPRPQYVWIIFMSLSMASKHVDVHMTSIYLSFTSIFSSCQSNRASFNAKLAYKDYMGEMITPHLKEKHMKGLDRRIMHLRDLK